MKSNKHKKYKCKVKAKGCHGEFVKFNSFKKTCDNPLCAIKLAVKDREKREEKKAKEERKYTRERKEQIKTRPQLISDAQTQFNRAIRIADRDEPCISCGKFDWEIEEKFKGGKWDAGHYLTRGGFPELRFHEDNCHKQCKSCNNPGPNKAVKVQLQYRINLIKKIGIKRVEALEAHHDRPQWTHDHIREIKSYYANLANNKTRRIDFD